MSKWYWLVILLTLVGTWNWFPLLPEVMVTHWGLMGEPNGWMMRSVGAWMIPVLLVLLWGLLEWAPRTDNRIRESKSFWGPYRVFGLGILLFLAGLQVAVMAVNLGQVMDMTKIMGWGLVLLAALMGRVLPDLPRNSVMGVRTPWSLASDRNWRITHWKTARLCRSVSLLGIIYLIVFPVPYGPGLVLVSFILALGWGIIYSFRYRN